MDPNDSMNPERFSAILENQRAIMVNQATILHNQNKIMRGMEQLFSFLPALQGSLPSQTTVPTTVNVAPIPSILSSSENSRGEQPPSAATQVPADTPSSVSPSPRVENTTPINTPTRPQAPLNSSTPAMVANPVKAVASSEDSSPGSDNENEGTPAPPLVTRKVLSEYITQEELSQIKCKSCSIGNFAVQLLRHIFDHSELDNKNCTGTRGKEAVDPDRLRFVKETVYELYAITSEDKINTWKHCIRAIDEYLRRPKRVAKGALSKTAMF